MDKNTAKYAAELFGTMVLVLLGCGSAVLAGSQIGFLGISLAFGLAVLAMVYAIGPISGCHINPAITIAMWLNKKTNSKDAAMYIIAQIVGALIGAGILALIVGGLPGANIAANGLGQNGHGELSPMKFSMEAGLIAEIVLTFIFVMVIFGATSKQAPAGFAGIPIGFSLVLIHLVGIPVTGVSVNPARSIGPAVVLGAFGNTAAIGQLWLFIIAPIIGGVLAALVWKTAFESK
jgi:aquaporin Z